MPKSRSSLVLLSLAVLLLGCAAQGRTPRPTDFPTHAAEPPFVLHWRVDPDSRSVAAVGVIEVGAPERIVGVTLELQGFDRGGRLVSRGRAWTYPRSFTGVEPWPFSASLRPTGSEDRFTVTVVDVTWKLQQPSGR